MQRRRSNIEEQRTSVFENGRIWFGAAVSIAEMLTGTYFAPLGFSKGLLAILLGHVIGCAMLFLAGLIDGKWIAVATTLIGTTGAIFLPLADITKFLYFIGSVFAPMIAIQIADFSILKQNQETNTFSIQNLIIWFVGFVIYRLLMRVNIVVGSTLPDMLITISLCVAINKIKENSQK